jgi:hypothetical protein
MPVQLIIASVRHHAQIDRMSRLGRRLAYDHDTFVTAAYLAASLAMPQRAFARGREGRQT